MTKYASVWEKVQAVVKSRGGVATLSTFDDGQCVRVRVGGLLDAFTSRWDDSLSAPEMALRHLTGATK